MRLRHQRRLLADQSTLARLQQELEDLRSLTQAQVTELQDRLDFAERLVARQNLPRLKGSDTPTPV